MSKTRWSCVAFIAFLAASLAAVNTPHAHQPAAAEWKLIWSDEFDGKDIDKTKWDFDLGNGFYAADKKTWIAGWGNNELEYYTKEPENAFVKDGMLHIKVLNKPTMGFDYTSARLKTRKADGTPLFNTKYGKVEFRVKAPTGQGIWPALWMMPQSDKYGGWAASGEIDVLEARGQEPNKILGTLHFGSRWPANAEGSKSLVLPDKGTIADFHTYGVEWDPGEIRWSFDGKVWATQSFWWSSGKTDGTKGLKPTQEADLNPWPAPFDQPFYLIMNVAVGGRFLGNPDRTTVFPAEMLIDYVRAYEKVGGYGPAKARGKGKLPFDK